MGFCATSTRIAFFCLALLAGIAIVCRPRRRPPLLSPEGRDTRRRSRAIRSPAEPGLRAFLGALRSRERSVGGIAGEEDPGDLALEQNLRLHRSNVAPAGVGEQVVDRSEVAQLLEVLDRREDQRDVAGAVGRERARRGEPAEVDTLLAVDPWLLPAGEWSKEEMRVEADLHCGGRDPARELDEGARPAERDPALLVQLADRGRSVGVVAIALAGVDGAPGEDPYAAHEARARRPTHEQELERVGAAAQQDHGRRLARRRGRARVVVLARPSRPALPARAHPLTLPAGSLLGMSTSTKTLQRWICESCGYIYDPEEGDPDGGIPSGTDFEDIPDTWFCSVCGARKRA